MKKLVLYIIISIVVILNCGCEPMYGIYFYNEYQDSIVLVEDRVGLRGEFIDDLFSDCEKYVVKPKGDIKFRACPLTNVKARGCGFFTGAISASFGNIQASLILRSLARDLR